MAQLALYVYLEIDLVRRELAFAAIKSQREVHFTELLYPGLCKLHNLPLNATLPKDLLRFMPCSVIFCFVYQLSSVFWFGSKNAISSHLQCSSQVTIHSVQEAL